MIYYIAYNGTRDTVELVLVAGNLENSGIAGLWNRNLNNSLGNVNWNISARLSLQKLFLYLLCITFLSKYLQYIRNCFIFDTTLADAKN